MISRNRIRTLSLILILLFLLPGVSTLCAQTKQLLTWRQNLIYLQNLPDSNLEEQLESVDRIRTGLEFWLQLHPEAAVDLPEAIRQPRNAAQIRKEISLLEDTIGTLLKQKSLRPFNLGVTEISVSAELSPLSPVADSIDKVEIENRRATNVVEALEYLPGLSLDFKPARNQSGIMIRGFDTRQIGLYLDNIPVYVPYDGYADIGRFLTRDVAEIQVAKGYSSPLLGPNGLGGAVNIVTTQPEKKLEGDILLGSGSGRMIDSGIHVGSRWDRFLFQGGMDWLETDYYPVSGDFNRANDFYGNQPSYNRANSHQRDADYDARIGYLPNERDQYIFSYMGQRAEYGAPPYSGFDYENNNPQYRQWPYWDRDSYYFTSAKGIGKSSELRFRAFYDHYPNREDTFLGPDPEAGRLPYSELSEYAVFNDHSAGFASEYSTRAWNRNTFSASFFFKDDTHKESDVLYNDGVPEPIPMRTQRDQQISIGLQDSIFLTNRIHATLGLSMENINGIKAQDLNQATYEIQPFECAGEAGAASFSGCLNEWAFNPLASVSFSVSKSGTLFATFAKKSHFPTMKDRYDYKNRKAIPNPTLEPEHTRNWSIGYSYAFPFKTMAQVELFRSDIYDAIEKSFIPDPTGICPKSDRKGFCQQSVNAGKELHQGVEITVRSNPHPRLILNLQYSYLSRSISGPEEMPPVYPTGTPKHKTVGTANILLPRNVSLTATARYESGNIGDFYTENGYIIPIPASKFATADLGGIIPVFDGAKLQIGVKNIFDRNYYFREGYPLAGRNWYANMQYRF